MPWSSVDPISLLNNTRGHTTSCSAAGCRWQLTWQHSYCVNAPNLLWRLIFQTAQQEIPQGTNISIYSLPFTNCFANQTTFLNVQTRQDLTCESSRSIFLRPPVLPSSQVSKCFSKGGAWLDSWQDRGWGSIAYLFYRENEASGGAKVNKTVNYMGWTAWCLRELEGQYRRICSACPKEKGAGFYRLNYVNWYSWMSNSEI